MTTQFGLEVTEEDVNDWVMVPLLKPTDAGVDGLCGVRRTTRRCSLWLWMKCVA